MTSDELPKNVRVQFRLNGKLVQGLVTGDKHKRIVVMTEQTAGDWRPVFIPLSLLSHIQFQHASRLFMPVYNPMMEGLLEQARRGDTDSW